MFLLGAISDEGSAGEMVAEFASKNERRTNVLASCQDDVISSLSSVASG